MIQSVRLVMVGWHLYGPGSCLLCDIRNTEADSTSSWGNGRRLRSQDPALPFSTPQRVEEEMLGEWDPLKEVLVHRPGIEAQFGLLEPRTFLFERHFNYRKARSEHDRLAQTLKDEGIQVHKLKDVVLGAAHRDPSTLDRLLQTVRSHLRYEGTPNRRQAAWDEFEEAVSTGLIDAEQLFNMVLLNPTVPLDEEPPRVVCEQPLANIMYVRDQQALGDRGFIVGRPEKQLRRRETQLTEIALEALGGTIVQRVSGRGTFEGGDFLPMGEFALIGLKPRTNQAAIDQILDPVVLGFDEVATVLGPAHPLLKAPDDMVCMHLDTYFNVISPGLAVASKRLVDDAMVTVYLRTREGYEKVPNSSRTLQEYISEKGIDLIQVSDLEQMCYASNFLCIKENRIIAVDVRKNAPWVRSRLIKDYESNPGKYQPLYYQFEEDYGRLTRSGDFFPNKREVKERGVEIIEAAVPNLTGGYGGVHCMTCAIRRG